MPTKYRPRNTEYRHAPKSGKKAPPTGTDADLNMVTLATVFSDEDKARAFLEAKRWPNGPVCPHCQSAEAYRLTPKPGSKSPVRPGVLKCKKCRKQFTVRVGTIFEDSKIQIRQWLMAIHLMTSSKKGVSSHQIAREVGITQKSAWFVCHRIREAMKREPMASMLAGQVELDEAYIGGKPRIRGVSKRGRGTSKAPVMVLVERDGRAVAKPIENVQSATLHREAAVHIAKEAVVMTDDFAAYNGIGKQFDGGHYSVNHSQKQYAYRDETTGMPVHTNTAESFFAILKRQHYGITHHMSRKHLHRYCTERSFMWDHRKKSDGARMVEAIRGAEGRRLMWRDPR